MGLKAGGIRSTEQKTCKCCHSFDVTAEVLMAPQGHPVRVAVSVSLGNPCPYSQPQDHTARTVMAQPEPWRSNPLLNECRAVYAQTLKAAGSSLLPTHQASVLY